MYAWHAHVGVAARLATHGDAEAGAVGARLDDLAPVIPGAQTVGHVAPHQARRQLHRFRTVGAQHHQSIKGHAVGEVEKRIGQGLLRPDVIEVLAVDVGDDRHHGDEVAE